MNKIDRIVVAGAGPAGMMAAIKAAENGGQVVLLEKMSQAGKKMLITGKGRCNITNVAEKQEIIRNIPGNGKFLYSCLEAYDNEDVQHFFHTLGVPTKVERGGRVFPVSDKAADVVNAMILYLHELGVELVTEAKVEEILTRTDDKGQLHAAGFRLADGREYRGDAAILATGGASYPSTGSTGDGCRLAQKLGHHIVKLLPSLVPLETEDDWVRELQGLSLKNIRATLLSDGKKVSDMFGEMLFTHFGISGPIVLSLSRQAARLLSKEHFVEIELDLKPALTLQQLDARLLRDFQKYLNKEIKNGMKDLLPGRLIEPVLDAAYLKPATLVNAITKEQRHRLAEVLKALPMIISDTRPIAEAIVTAGGVDTGQINPRTMESKLVKGLYFAGETIDVDGYTGGFNLQAAFSMGAAAGCWSVWDRE